LRFSLLLQCQIFWVLQRSSNFHVQFLDGIALLKHFRRRELPSLSDLCNLAVLQSNYDILWFEVRMDDLAHTMHVVETDEALSGEFAS